MSKLGKCNCPSCRSKIDREFWAIIEANYSSTNNVVMRILSYC